MAVLDNADLLGLVAAGPARRRAQVLATVAPLSRTHYTAVCAHLAEALGVSKRAANPRQRTLSRLLLEYLDRVCRKLDEAQPYPSELIADWCIALRLPRLLVGHSFAEEARTLFRSRRKKMTAAEKTALAHSLGFLVGDIPLRAFHSFPPEERQAAYAARSAWETLQEMLARGTPIDHQDCKRLRTRAAAGRKPSLVRAHLEREGGGREVPLLRATDTALLYFWQAGFFRLSHDKAYDKAYDQMPLVERIFWHAHRLEDWDALIQQLPPGSEVVVLADHPLDDECARVRKYVWAVRVRVQ